MANGDRVVIDFGRQRLKLPWSEPRSELLTPYHGQPVIVSIRPEVLAPVADDPAAGDPAGDDSAKSVLHGKVSALEYYGHDWLARLDAGLRPVDIDAVRAGRPDPQDSHSHHRGASLLVRVGAHRGWMSGQEVDVAVDVPGIHVFDSSGRRIDRMPVGLAAMRRTGAGGWQG